jgi:hypothetical protein
MTKKQMKGISRTLEPVHKATYQNTEKEDYLNIDNDIEIGTAVKKLEKFNEICQQSKEKESDEKEEEKLPRNNLWSTK